MDEVSPNASDANEMLSLGEVIANTVVSSAFGSSEVTDSMCLLSALELGIEAPMKTDRKSVPEMRSSLPADLARVCLAKGNPRTGRSSSEQKI
jgi:hypothetical protein